MSYAEEGIVPPFYVRNGREWADRAALLAVSDVSLSATAYERATILPLRRRGNANVAGAVFEGGVVDARRNFIAGHVRGASADENLSCTRPYDFSRNDLVESDERVVFGGVLYNHFGHQLVDTVSRLWYVAEHKDALDGRKLAFVLALSHKGASMSKLFDFMLDALGIPRDAVMLVEEPTRFSEVVVPDESISIMSDANTACARVYRTLRDSVEPGTCEKVFLSRGVFEKRDCINERFLEEFFARRGFCIVHPETLSYAEQISLLSGAREIVSTVGTMSHLATLFSRDDARLTYFVRANTVIPQQLLLDKLCGKEPFYVDATRSLLPTTHASGAFLFGPTWCMREYLNATGTPFEESELNDDVIATDDVMTFLHTYAAAAEKESNQARLRGFDMSDVLCSLAEGLDGNVRSAEGDAFAAARPRDRLLGKRKAWASLRECSYDGGRMTLGVLLKSPVGEGDFSLSLVSAKDARREPLAISSQQVEGALVRVTVGLREFFAARAAEPAACERWDIHAEFSGLSTPLGLEEGKKPFIQFTRFFMYEDGKLLVPHLNGEGVACLWYIGEQRNDFSKDFFAVRMNRPLVSDLLYRIIRAERYDVVARLHAEFAKGKIRCTPLEDGTILYHDKLYYVASYAHMEACTQRRVRSVAFYETRRTWIRRVVRVLRALHLWK